ncbi:MAG: molybdopterin-dependent oxidoreductase, partial [Candidatus Ornithospirochaeta sp.]|nr:molybdopterin-dependent oxidoreductase [Candidatus Ornithospirochaeta sp.]
PRRTPAVDRFADIHLQNYPGTDGAIAHGIARLLIERDLIDHEYIEKHVHGFSQYSQYVSSFTPERVEELSGVPKEKLLQAVDLIASSMPLSIPESVSPIVHHRNGVQNYRAIMALSAILGCYDRKGGNLPRYNTFSHMGAGYETREHEFIHEREKADFPPAVGALRFPVFKKVAGYGQCLDLGRQILEGTPYPIKALVAFGMNYRMFPEDGKMLEAFKELDFYVDADLFWTESAYYADLVLPACSVLERSEFKAVRGGKGYWIEPLIDPLGESKSDYEIIKGIADILCLDDELLRSSYEKCIDYMLSDHGITANDLRKAAKPITMPGFKPYTPGSYTERGYKTPTGKFELFSTVLEEYGYDPLPTYRSSLDDADRKEYPMILFTGSSIPSAYNSRLKHVEALNRIRPEAQADISEEDALAMGIAYNDMIKVSTPLSSIVLKANPSRMIKAGTVSIYHGYKDADVNKLIGAGHLDPISGFCGFKSVRCRIERA